MRESALNLPEATRAAARERYNYLKALKPTAPRFFHVSRYYTSKTLTRKDGTTHEVLIPSVGSTYKKRRPAPVGDNAPAL